ncbi:glycosyl transferase family 8 protein [Diplocarpon rosae]|nr:glycosyl transferase family 8 protein [Diplocarpon rosae]
MVEYERILFIDADTLITRPIDAIFDEMMVRLPAATLFNVTRIKNDEAMLPANYMFGARSDNALTGERDHPYPPIPTKVFSAGFWMAAPSREMFVYLMSVMQHWRRFDPFAMEQSLLNYAFRRDGPMPWLELPPQWSATWPNMRDWDAGVATLHEKWWGVGPDELRAKWNGVRTEMEQFFEARP